MAEIKTPPRITLDADGEEHVTFGPEHCWADVVRWIAGNRSDLEAVHDLIVEELSKPEPETQGEPRWTH